mgnify:CR=1 FL=1
MVPTAKQAALEAAAFAHGFLVKIVDTFPADKRTYQISRADNHILWSLGHLATTYEWLLSLLKEGGQKLPAEYQALFGSKSEPNPDVKAYPGYDQLRKDLDHSYDALIAAFQATSDADLAKPTLSDTGGFVPTRLGALTVVTWHDGWHSGQLSTLRRSLGLPSVFGA